MSEEQKQELVEFLNTRCNGRYCPTSDSVRFIPKDTGASTQFIRIERIATACGVAPSGRDLTFRGERKLARLEEMGVTIDRSPAAQQGVILGR